jgi:hypothetical protein
MHIENQPQVAGTNRFGDSLIQLLILVWPAQEISQDSIGLASYGTLAKKRCCTDL